MPNWQGFWLGSSLIQGPKKAIGFRTVPATPEESTDIHKDYDGPGEDRILFVREL